MKTGFILLSGKRVRLSSIKKYEPMQSNNDHFGIRVFYSLAAKRDHDVFYFDCEDLRDEALSKLDESVELV